MQRVHWTGRKCPSIVHQFVGALADRRPRRGMFSLALRVLADADERVVVRGRLGTMRAVAERWEAKAAIGGGRSRRFPARAATPRRLTHGSVGYRPRPERAGSDRHGPEPRPTRSSFRGVRRPRQRSAAFPPSVAFGRRRVCDRDPATICTDCAEGAGVPFGAASNAVAITGVASSLFVVAMTIGSEDARALKVLDESRPVSYAEPAGRGRPRPGGPVGVASSVGGRI